MPVERMENDSQGQSPANKRLENQGFESQTRVGKPPQSDGSAIAHTTRGRVVSIPGKKDAEAKKGSQKESLESILSSALRSEDAELDEILSALEEIAESVKAGTTHPPEVEKALQKAASGALKQSLLDREIRSLAITDELTGLYNRRGFLASATHQIKLAQRNAQNVLLLFCDLDDLKGINDSFGHQEGDLALIRTADALEDTFRDSDIVARLGGDEFAVLASEASMPNREDILPRLEESLARDNAAEARYQLSLSIGVARFDPLNPSTLGELMARADKDMYAHKKYSRRTPVSGRR
jgi:diguanylate cyclase (GGDEF)-like protein